MLTKILILCVISVMAIIQFAHATPEILWMRTFGGSNNDSGISVKQTTDGGYIIAARTSSYGAGSDDFWLIKTDAKGNEEWNRTFGGENADYCLTLQQTTDGGYILVGDTSSFGAGKSDAWLIKTDGNGSEEWNKTYGGSIWDFGKFVQQTNDSGYIITGYTDSFSEVWGRDLWLIKTDANGNQEWMKVFGGDGHDQGGFVQQTKDGGYIISGSTNSNYFYGSGPFNKGGYDAWLVKTDSTGTVQWHRTFGGSENEGIGRPQQTSDGGYIITGWTESYGSGDKNAWLIRTDANGVEKWSKIFEGNGNNSVFGRIQETSDGGYIITGSTHYGENDQDAWIIKIDANANEEWNMTFGGSNDDGIGSLQQTSDGGYIIAGTTSSYGAGRQDVWLIKLGGSVPELKSVSLDMENSDEVMTDLAQISSDEGKTFEMLTETFSGDDDSIPDETTSTKVRLKDGMRMMLIEAGEFSMGDHHDVGDSDEKPVHIVYLDAYYIDETEVTNEQYCAFLNAYGKNEDAAGHQLLNIDDERCLIEKIGETYKPKLGYEKHPVIDVNWYGAAAYAQWVGARLPTEAEWEKAARGGLVGKKYPWGDEMPPPKLVGNFADESVERDFPHWWWHIKGYNDGYVRTAPVGRFPPNGYRLFDITGNAWEWCADEYNSDYYSQCPKNNPKGPGVVITFENDDFINVDTMRVLRGGMWGDNAYNLRCASRLNDVPSRTLNYLGFRCVQEP